MPAENLPYRYDEEDITEEYSFDELAKGMAEGTLSRRRALKTVAGAILGGSLLASFLVKPTPAKAQTSAALCPERIPRPGFDPSQQSNGCGSYQTPGSHEAARWLSLYNVDFTEACNEHDICYTTCNSSKDQCEAEFLANMLDICEQHFFGESRNRRKGRNRGEHRNRRKRRNRREPEPTRGERCRNIAVAMAAGTATAGGAAYEAAQNEACICLPE